ncbi:hypothetical protein D6D01_04949 [Aureobasidium pullulans]|uniref:Uncharacterized protein n=1 Tax=Aureobasidium pullulans TaxID=5580 RepID=A0A4S9LAS7_AURPU|nr:hypothetical protein D6D01_04949 [Aureobasidium pullulans]
METIQTSQDEAPTLRWNWIQEQVGLTREELEAGDGCHPDEAKVLGDYLENDWNAQQAAEKFTSSVLQEQDTFATLYRPWGLLSTALVELPADRQKLVELLLAIQSMLPLQRVDWSQLPGWAAMWSDLYRQHFHGSADWEHWPTEEKAKLYVDFTNRGAAEAEMFLRGIAGVPVRWGYEALSPICSRRPGLD